MLEKLDGILRYNGCPSPIIRMLDAHVTIPEKFGSVRNVVSKALVGLNKWIVDQVKA